MFHSLNPCTDFHQIFRVCLAQEDLGGVSCNNCCHDNTFKFLGLKVCGLFLNLNPCIDFDLIFRICLTQADLELISFLGGYLARTIAVATL